MISQIFLVKSTICPRIFSNLSKKSALAVLACAALFGLLPAQQISQQALFAEASFDRWQAEGQREQVPWKVKLFPVTLSVHQRLEAGIEVHLPFQEIAARRNHRIFLLLQVIDPSRRRYRTCQVLDLDQAAPDPARGKRQPDVPFFWGMFVLPGNYDVEVGLYDQATGEHNLERHKLEVAPLDIDPLPSAWRELPSVEFLSPATGGLDGLYRSDVEGRLNLPLRTGRPLHLEILADMTASEAFFSDTAGYERYLAGILPIVKVLSQISPSKGSVSVAALDLDRRRVTMEQPNLHELRWPPWKESLVSGGPGVVSMRSLMERRRSPEFLRDELVRRLKEAPDAPGPAGDPVVVFVVVGGPMDTYSFPDLSPISLSGQADCMVFYLQYDAKAKANSKAAAGGSKNVEKMLRPLRVRTFTVRSAESIRHTLARVMEEISRM
ncbi:MAG TPA: hypothetical protein VKE93_02935 [Candidatus Angelobacter sp.]|nr:hypothetical protein [Candidatus Angelobacter sp.]